MQVVRRADRQAGRQCLPRRETWEVGSALPTFPASYHLLAHSQTCLSDSTCPAWFSIHPAGAAVSPLQKARMSAACRPLHPDVAAIVREGLQHYGLLPAGGGDGKAALAGTTS